MMKKAIFILRILLIGMLSCLAMADGVAPEFHGAGWFQFGRIKESYSLPGNQNDYNNNWMQNAGGVLSAKVKIDENWEGALELGAIQVHLARGALSQASLWYPFWVPFTSEARVSYSRPILGNGAFQMTLGLFPYSYSPDAKNLGLYLMRGYVYPGTLVSGFGNLFGAKARLSGGGFWNDLIIKVETEDKPLFDMSIANVINYRIHPSFEIGAGVNFYRVIPQNSEVTSPTRECDAQVDMGPYASQGQDNPCYIRDSVGVDAMGNAVYDTVTGSLSGAKLMVRFHLDPKIWFGSPEILGAGDLIIYGEAALLGIKDYPVFYEKKSERMPMMIGINLPGFGFLNYSLELEYYASKNWGNDLGAQNGSWIPGVNTSLNHDRDNIKWSFNASKVFFGNMEAAVRIANDHLRLGGHHNLATGVEALTTPKDWYWTFKLAYFF